MGSGGGSTKTVQTNDPWSKAEPHILQGLDSASAMWESDPNQFVIQPWDGPAVAQQSGAEVAAKNAIVNNATPQHEQLLAAQRKVNRVGDMAGSQQNAAPMDQAVSNSMNAGPNAGFAGAVNSATGMKTPGTTGTALQTVSTQSFNPVLKKAVTSAESLGTTSPFDTGVQAGAKSSPTGLLSREANQAANMGGTPQLTSVANRMMNATTSAGLNNSVSKAQNLGQNSTLGQGVNQAMTGGQNQLFNSMVNKAALGQRDAFSQNTLQGIGKGAPNFGGYLGQAQGGANATLNQGVSKAMNIGMDSQFNRTTQNAGQADQTALDMIGQGAGSSQDRNFTHGINRAMTAGEDSRLTDAISAQRSGNTQAFDSAINAATNDPYGDDMRAMIGQNVAESVMPNINGSFGQAGMTGSSLHAAAAAKGMASAMAPIELQAANQARDRALQAGQMSQDAQSDQLLRMLQGAQIGQGVSDASADRAMRAGALSQQAQAGDMQRAMQAGQARGGLTDAAANRSLDAAGMRQAATESGADRALAAGQASQQATEAQRQRAMQSAGLYNQAGNTSADQRLQAAQLSQGAFDSAQGRALQAAGMAQGATESTLDRRLQAGQMSAADQMQRAQLGLDASQMQDSARQGYLDRALAGGQALSNERMAQAGLGLEAGQTLNQAQLAANDQRMQAGQMSQQDALARAGLGLQAGQQMQDAQLGMNAQRLQAGQMASDQQMERARLGLDAQGMYDQSQQNYLGLQQNAGQMAQDARMNNMGMSLDAAGMAPAMSEATYNPYDRMRDVGESNSQRNQQQLAADILNYQQQQAGPIDALNNYMSLVSGLGGQFGTSIANTQQNVGSMGMMGMGMQGMGLLSMLSDRRAKENIRRVGQTDEGLPVYIYNYKGSVTPQMGVMADEVEKVKPEAVVTLPSGLKAVNYGELA